MVPQHIPEELSRKDLCEILTCLQRLLSCKRREQLDSSLFSVADYLGFEYVLYGYTPAAYTEPAGTRPVNLTNPEAWGREFAEEHLPNDPVLYEAGRRISLGEQVGCIVWDSYDWRLRPEQEKVIKRRSSYGLKYGCTMFVNSPKMDFAFYLSLSAKKREPDRRTEAFFAQLLPQMMVTGKQLCQLERVRFLSETENAVADGLRNGRTNREIAELLRMSENTVKYHLKSIYAKLQVRNRQQAIERLMVKSW